MTTTHQSTRISDFVIDGLLAGLGAGFVMGVYLLVTGLFLGFGIVETLDLFTVVGPSSPFVGGFSHLAVSGIYGAFFGVLYPFFVRRLSVPSWAAGLGFGVLLFLIGNYALVPGTGSRLVEISPLNFGIAHLLYGLVLGWLVGRPSRR